MSCLFFFFFLKQPVLHNDFLSKGGGGHKSILMDICNSMLREIVIGLKHFFCGIIQLQS